MIREVSQSHTLAEQLETAADSLRCCLSERFFVKEGSPYVMRGHNECVSLYCRPDHQQATVLAEKLEQIVGPIRDENAIRLLNKINKLSAAILEAIAAES